MKNFSYGFVEQCLISLLNFIIIICFSRFLNPSEFAKFIIIFSTITVVYLVCTGIWSNPVLVYLPTMFSEISRFYIRFISTMNILTAVALSIFSLIIVDKFIRNLDFTEFVYAVLLSTCWCQYELIRKINYAIQSLHRILISSTALIIAFGLLSIFFKNSLDTSKSVLLLFLSYLIAILLIGCLGSAINNYNVEKEINDYKEILEKHWNYAKWTIIGGVCYWICTQGYFIIVANYISDKQLGGLRAAMNLLGLITPLLVFFENAFTPKVSKVYHNDGIRELEKYIFKIYKISTVPFLLFVILVTAGAYWSFPLIYGKQYNNSTYLTIFFGVYQLILGLNRPAVIGLRAMNVTKYFFKGNLVAAIVTTLLGINLAKEFRDVGVALTILIAGTYLTIYFIISFKQVSCTYHRNNIKAKIPME